MVLTSIDIVNGTLSLIFVAISIFVGLNIILKYRKIKEKTLLYVGITWIIMCEPWWPHSISFVLALATGNGLNVQQFYFFATTFVPIGLTAWLKAFTDLISKKKQNLILSIAILGQGIFEVIFFYFLLTNPSIIAEMRTPVDAETKSFVLIYFLVVLCIFLITGIIFAKKAMKSDKAETKVKGKILFAAILLYVIGAILDGVVATEYITLFISRIILASSAIAFYNGFILPNWLKKRIIKTESSN